MRASEFGRLLKDLRTSKHATLAEVAHGTGVSVPMLSRMERGERLPSAETLTALSSFFGVSEDALTQAVVVQHARNRYPGWSDRAARDSSRDGLAGGPEPQILASPVSDLGFADHPFDVRHETAVSSLSEVPVARRTRPLAGPVFRARPIGELFGEAGSSPAAALDDAAHAAEAAVRQLIREYERSTPTLNETERRRVDGEIARLRDALGSLGDEG
jgi:transcriptional regulator with XRE-family HTH domain